MSSGKRPRCPGPERYEDGTVLCGALPGDIACSDPACPVFGDIDEDPSDEEDR